MRENKILTTFKNGGAIINGWAQLPTSFAAEVFANSGWDSITIDMQHGPVDYQRALEMLQGIETEQTPAMARVPWNEPGIIMKMLDAGCLGIICPMINTRAQCEAFVGACRYPPMGYRSFGPLRASMIYGDDYASNANNFCITMAMIETKEAVENLESILTVPGLDAIYIGPADLSQSYGYPPKADPTVPQIVETVEYIVNTARKHGIYVGMHCADVAYGLEMVKKGIQFITILGDSRLLQVASMNVTKQFKSGAATASAQASGGPY